MSVELRELAQAGPWVWASLALGGAAVVLAVVGVTTLVLRRSSAFGIGLATLVFATLAAAAGIGGTVAERRALEFMAHTLAGTSAVSDHLLVVGYWHSRQSSWVGLFAALAPFIAGVVVAVLASRRVREGRIAGEATAAGEQRSGRLLLAGLFSGLAGLGLVGTVLVPRREPPVWRLHFAANDDFAWNLAIATDGVERDVIGSCASLEDALHYRDGALGSLELVHWKEAAAKCVRVILSRTGPTQIASSAPVKTSMGAVTVVMRPEGLATSELVLDDAVKEQVANFFARKLSTVTVGERPPAEVQHALDLVAPKVWQCFELKPGVAGVLLVRFELEPSGAVTLLVTERLEEPLVTNCVGEVVRAVAFPASTTRRSVSTSYAYGLDDD